MRVRVRVRALRRSKAQHRLANLAAAQWSVVQGRAAETRKCRRLAAEEAGGQGSCSAGIAVPKSAASLANLAAAQRFKPQPLLANKLKFSVVLRTVS